MGSGFKTWAPGDVLTATDVNGYLMQQVVITCTSGTRPSSPVEGMHIFETNTDRLLVYNGTTWVESGGTQMVRARVKDGGGGTISTTEAVEATLTLAIPTTWVSYDVDVWVMVRCAETGVATGSTTVSLRVRKTNTAGAEWGNTVALVGDVAPSNAVNTAFAAYAEGETTTGSVSIVFTASAGSNNGLIGWDDLVMTAYAWRTA